MSDVWGDLHFPCGQRRRDRHLLKRARIALRRGGRAVAVVWLRAWPGACPGVGYPLSPLVSSGWAVVRGVFAAGVHRAVSPLLCCLWVISLWPRSNAISMVMTRRHASLLRALLSLSKFISLRSSLTSCECLATHSSTTWQNQELLTSLSQLRVSLSSAAPGRCSSVRTQALSSSPASSCVFTSWPPRGLV